MAATLRFSMDNNGSIESLRDGNSSEVLFVRRRVMLNGKLKTRGGAYVCAPIFGPKPNIPEYEAIGMPRHGVLRDGRYEDSSPADLGLVHRKVFKKLSRPWPHTLEVSIQYLESTRMYLHQIEVQSTGKDHMPLSLGWHPYFATHGQSFVVEYADMFIESKDLLVNESWMIPCSSGAVMYLWKHDGSRVSMQLAGDYTHFCVWTDAPEQYICIKPVMELRCLASGERVSCTCFVILG